MLGCAHTGEHTLPGASPLRFGFRARSPEIPQASGRDGRADKRAPCPVYSPGSLQLLEGAGAGPLARLLQGAVVLRGLPGEGDGQDSLSE